MISLWFLLSTVSVGFADAICNDGWYSSSCDSGTCSQHEGVQTWVAYSCPDRVYHPEHVTKFQRPTGLEAWRLAFGILPKEMRQLSKVTDGTLVLTDEQVVMLRAAALAQSEGYQPTPSESTWARAMYSIKQCPNLAYRKGFAYISAMQGSANEEQGLRKLAALYLILVKYKHEPNRVSEILQCDNPNVYDIVRQRG